MFAIWESREVSRVYENRTCHIMLETWELFVVSCVQANNQAILMFYQLVIEISACLFCVTIKIDALSYMKKFLTNLKIFLWKYYIWSLLNQSHETFPQKFSTNYFLKLFWGLYWKFYNGCTNKRLTKSFLKLLTKNYVNKFLRKHVENVLWKRKITKK